jgi:hypothetical protein
MAVRDWHAGQLAVFWIGALLLGLVLFYVSGQVETTTTIVYPPERAGQTDPHPVGDVVASVLGLLVLAIPITLLAITWKWFDGKRKAAVGSEVVSRGQAG